MRRTREETILALRLWGYLTAAHRNHCGVDPPETLEDVFAGDVDIFPVGDWGVCAFRDEYMYCAFPPFDRYKATRDTYAILERWFKTHPRTLHAVHPLNFPSVRITRKIGAVPVGVDGDGFVQYELTRERFRRHGQEVCSS